MHGLVVIGTSGWNDAMAAELLMAGRGATGTGCASARDASPHRGQRHLLPAAGPAHLRPLARGNPAGLSARGQGQPLSDPRQAPADPVEPIQQERERAGPGRQAGGRAVAIAGQPAEGHGPAGTLRPRFGRLAGYPPVVEFRHPSWFVPRWRPACAPIGWRSAGPTAADWPLWEAITNRSGLMSACTAAPRRTFLPTNPPPSTPGPDASGAGSTRAAGSRLLRQQRPWRRSPGCAAAAGSMAGRARRALPGRRGRCQEPIRKLRSCFK